MREFKTEDIRNVALIAHGGTGKTNLAEAIMYKAKAIDRQGKVSDGNTVMDFDPEETKRKISINASVASVEWNDTKINLIDTPGFFDFEGEMLEGISVADSVIIMVSGKAGVQVGTERAWEMADDNKIPKIIFVNEIDEENVDFTTIVDSLKEHFGKSIAPVFIPIREGGTVTGYIDVVHAQAKLYVPDSASKLIDMPPEYEEEFKRVQDMLFEAVAEQDDDLMNKYFEGEPFTPEEIVGAVKKGIEECSIVPVSFGSALKNVGVKKLIETIIEFYPCPSEIPQRKGVLPDTDEIVERKCTDGEPTSLFVFKTLADPFIGKLSYFKVLSGTLRPDTALKNSRTGEAERIGKIYAMRGKKQTEVSVLHAGDIGAAAKMPMAKTSDTLYDAASPIEYERIAFPEPTLSLAIFPAKKGDEEKISASLAKLREEDPTFTLETNRETKEMIISGMGEQHIDVLKSKLKNRYGVETELKTPKVPYRETIRKKVKAEGKHKKQSGGHGQYGHVWIEFEPGEGTELEFSERVFGGSVPKNYFPAVEKGLEESVASGVLAGYPVVHLKATLFDGSYHPVDSSEMAFKMAAHNAFKAGLKEASPVLLEPIGELKVRVPDRYTGDIMSDINKRRGRVLGMNPSEKKGTTEILAEVPVSEMHTYSTDLRSMSRARGRFTYHFVRYEEAPMNVAEKVIAAAGKEE